MPAPPSHSFTVTANGVLRVLMTQCQVCVGHLPEQIPPDLQKHGFNAIWDTGATGSVITRQVVQACGLIPTGMRRMHGVQGVHDSLTYLVNIVLPNSVQMANVDVTEGMLPGGAAGDVLIGMDIIVKGDFAVTNKGGTTKFSFRLPSLVHTDYVHEHQAALRSLAPVAKARKKAPKQFGKRKK